MKIGAVSGDLVVKLALGALAIAAAVYGVKRLQGALPSPGAVLDQVAAGAQAVNPLNPNNVFATGVNGIGGAIVTDPAGPGKNADGSWSLGGWAFDVLNPDIAAARDNFGGGATGSW